MSKEKIYIFDTTLRDGAQTESVNFSIEDKNRSKERRVGKECRSRRSPYHEKKKKTKIKKKYI